MPSPSSGHGSTEQLRLAQRLGLAAGSLTCSQSLSAIQQASLDIGISLAPEKCEGPKTRLVFLGIELDSEHMTARLPDDKLDDLRTIICGWVHKKTTQISGGDA